MATRSSSASMVNFHVKLACASIACLASVTAQAAVELHSQVIRPGFSVISGAGGNVVVWSGADGVVLVDTGLAESSAVLVEAVTRIAPGRVRFVLNTNGHSDHTGGNEAFARGGATVIGHESLREYAGRDPATAVAGAEGPAAAVASRPSSRRPPALHLNGDRLAALHVEAAHTDGDLVLWWEDAKRRARGRRLLQRHVSFHRPRQRRLAGGRRGCARDRAVPCRFTDDHHPGPRAGVESRRTGRVSGHARRDGPARARVDGEGRNLDEVLAARPTAAYDAVYGQGSMTVERFVGILFEDLAGRR